MDKKDKIDTLIDQYLNFYQHGSQAIEPQQSTNFDSLMNQYKSKFDKQIANEQKAIREKEEARVLQKNRKRNYKVKKERPKNNKTSCVKRNCVIIPKKLRQKLNKPQKNTSTQIVIMIKAVIIKG